MSLVQLYQAICFTTPSLYLDLGPAVAKTNTPPLWLHPQVEHLEVAPCCVLWFPPDPPSRATYTETQLGAPIKAATHCFIRRLRGVSWITVGACTLTGSPSFAQIAEATAMPLQVMRTGAQTLHVKFVRRGGMPRYPSVCLSHESTFACRLESNVYSVRCLGSKLLLKFLWS